MLLIAILLSTTEVGWYGMAVAAVSIGRNFSHSINKPILRKLNFERGKQELTDLGWFKTYFEKPLTIYMFYSSLWAGIICLTYTWLIHYYLTAYTNAIIPLFILTAGSIICSSMSMFSFFINVTDQFKIMMISRLVLVSINLFFNTLLIKLGHGINAVAVVSSASYAIYIIFITVFVFSKLYVTGLTRSIGHLMRLFSVTAVLLAFILSYYSIINENPGGYPFSKIPEILTVTVCYVLLTILVFSITFLRQNIHKELINISKTILFTSLRIKEVKA